MLLDFQACMDTVSTRYVDYNTINSQELDYYNIYVVN